MSENASKLGSSLVAYNSTLTTTTVGETYEFCSLSLPEGKWLLIGACLASGDLTFDNADYGTKIRSRRTAEEQEKTGLIIGLATGPKTVKMKLTAAVISSTIHNDGNYCYMRAIRIG